jgi:hypothetical protein
MTDGVMETRVDGLHTDGPWADTFFCKPDGSPILTVEDVAETIAGSARHSESVDLYGVTLNDADRNPDGRATVVCYTGNGPNAHNNARVIAAVPQMVRFLRHLLHERDHGFVYSRDEADARRILAFVEGRREEAQAADADIGVTVFGAMPFEGGRRQIGIAANGDAVWGPPERKGSFSPEDE